METRLRVAQDEQGYERIEYFAGDEWERADHKISKIITGTTGESSDNGIFVNNRDFIATERFYYGRHKKEFLFNKLNWDNPTGVIAEIQRRARVVRNWVKGKQKDAREFELTIPDTNCGDAETTRKNVVTCPDCKKEYVHCAHCGTLEQKQNACVHSGTYYCEHCHYTELEYCDCCDRMYIKDDMVICGDKQYCTRCYQKYIQ